MLLAHKVQRLLRVGRALHVHADEAVDANGVVEQFADVVARQFLIHVQSHVGQLDADVGVELAALNLVEELVIEPLALKRLLAVGDVFAEVIHRHVDADAVHGLGGLDQVIDRHAGHKALADLLAEGGFFCDGPDAFTFREGNKKGAKHVCYPCPEAGPWGLYECERSSRQAYANRSGGHCGTA